MLEKTKTVQVGISLTFKRVDFVEEILCESFCWGDTRITIPPWDSWLVCSTLQVSRCWFSFCYNVSCPPSTAKTAPTYPDLRYQSSNTPRERNLPPWFCSHFFVVWLISSASFLVRHLSSFTIGVKVDLFFSRVFFGKPSVWWIEDWMVVSNMFNFHLYLGKWSNLTSIFFRSVGSTPQLEDEFESSPQNVEIFKPNVSQSKNISSWELTYPVKIHFWRWFSFPQVGYSSPL